MIIIAPNPFDLLLSCLGALILHFPFTSGSLRKDPYVAIPIPRKKRKESLIANSADQAGDVASSNHLEASSPIKHYDNIISSPNENGFVLGRRRGRWRTVSSATTLTGDVASLNENGSVSGRRRRSRWGKVAGLSENVSVSESRIGISPANHGDNNIASLKENGYALGRGRTLPLTHPENNEDETLMPSPQEKTSSPADSDYAAYAVIPEKLCADMSGWANTLEANIEELLSTVAMVVANVIRDGASAWNLNVAMDSEGIKLHSLVGISVSFIFLTSSCLMQSHSNHTLLWLSNNLQLKSTTHSWYHRCQG